MPPLSEENVAGPDSSGALFALRDAGAWANFDQNDGHPNTPIVLPSREADDELFAFTFGNGVAAPIEIANWLALAPLFGGGLVVWRRVATGDANDNFTVAAVSNFTGSYQIASFRIPVGTSLIQVANSVLTAGIGVNDWQITALAASTPFHSLVLAFFTRFSSNDQVGLTVTDNTTLTLIGSQAHSTAGGLGRTVWGGWSFRIDVAPLATPAVDQGYTPAPVAADTFTRVFRFGLVHV